MLETYECAARIMSSPACQFSDTEHPKVIEMQKYLTMSITAANFVCRDNVEGMSLCLRWRRRRYVVTNNEIWAR